MITIFILISAIISSITGATVIILGDWKRFALKFAAVALCFMVDVALLSIIFFHPDEMMNPNHDRIFGIVGMLLIAKNIDHLLFYISFGRDAISLRRKDRRLNTFTVRKEAA